MKIIHVTGDPICDHNYYQGLRPTADSPEQRGLRFFHSGGGALLTKDIIAAATKDLDGWKIEFGLNPDFKELPPAFHAFCLWEPQPYNVEEKDTKKGFDVWRAIEPPAGLWASCVPVESRRHL
jgi:hypothetical protein